MKVAYLLIGALALISCATYQTLKSPSSLPAGFHVLNLIDEHTFVFDQHRFSEASIGPALVAASENDSVRIFVLRYPKTGMSLGTFKAVMPALRPGAKGCLYFRGENDEVKQIASGGVTTVGDIVAGGCPSEDTVRSSIGPYSVPAVPQG